MAHLAPNKFRAFDSSGDPLVGGKLYTYEAGTSTPLVTYQNKAESTQNTNPVVLDANGEASVWLGSSAYKLVLKDSLDITQWTEDNITFLNDGAVTTAKLADGSVTTAKVANVNITATKLATDAVETAKIKDSNVTTAKIADSNVTTAKIADSNVTTAKIADSNVTTAKIADSNVTTAKIADSNVTTAKIADSNVTTAKIAANAVTRAKLESVGQQLSSACGTSFSHNTSTPTDITNLSVTITTTGRPVYLALVHDSSANQGFLNASDNSAVFQARLVFVRGSTTIADHKFVLAIAGNTAAITIGFTPTVSHIDVVAAGTYTYKAQLAASGGGSQVAYVGNLKLLAFEL